MINKILVEATIKAFKNILDREGLPYDIRNDEESRFFMRLWEETEEDRDRAYIQAAPAVERIVAHEPYLFIKDGDPLLIRINYLDRKLERDSFGEIMIERPDLDWRFAISVKSDAKILTSMDLADRELDMSNDDEIKNSFNAIEDFGNRIFSVPCSNEYFNEMNDILLNIAPHDKDSWSDLIKNDDFVYGKLITPMLRAMGREMPRIFKYHPEAPQKLFDYFYGKLDYYFINPIEEVKATRIGCVNARGQLGRMPNNSNLMVPRVRYPSELLDVRFATGQYGELSRDTLQLSFDGGWSLCIVINPVYDTYGELGFDLRVYLPVTPYGSYRDQVAWSSAE